MAEAARGTGEDVTWWCSPTLARTWESVAARLEQTGLVPTGRVTIGGLSLAEQRSVSDLLGQSVIQDRVRIDMARLDDRLRGRAGLALVEAAARGAGRPLIDRQADRARRAAERAAPRTLAERWAADHPQFPADLIDAWVDGLARDGILTRDDDPVALVGDALAVLADRASTLAPEGAARHHQEPIARTELATKLRGDAHALDDNRRLASVVLRLIVQLTDESRAGGLANSRALWERLGVVSDRVSSTCLMLGVRLSGASAAAARHTQAADRPVHLTWRDLDDLDRHADPDQGAEPAAGQRIFVCENPRVLEAAAEIGIPGWGVVCTSGRPSLVTVEVLERLRSAGAQLRYHGDFDWPGLAMANDLVDRFGAEPWRMAADDYLALPAQLTLSGRRVDARWDLELAPAMAHRGLAVHEEATLPALLRGL